ncbi:MAG TPA: PQQ-dependent sugar dehydrogenase, partial [Caulobacteraceae bacterium]|jgi:glucose/arabinose dehydrogenase
VNYGRANTQYQPAVAGQTRAPAAQRTHAWRTEPVASGLGKGWAIEPLPDGRWLVTEKRGALRIVAADGTVGAAITTGLPAVDARGQGGLLDVALAPDFRTSRRIYWSYSEPREGGNGTAVASGVLGENAVTDVRVIWRMQPTLDSTMHFGSRLVFARDGTLFVTTGERSILPGRAQAQDLNSHFGKIVRINADGTVPRDNPFANRSGVRPDIYASGVRNVQSAALHPRTGELWEVEHGPAGGDELNRILPGRDYGWPTISYGNEYAGGPIGEGRTAAPNMEQPVYYWDPVIAPSGMEFYTGDRFPAWRDSVFVGDMKTLGLVRLVLTGNRVVAEERLQLGSRIRDVKQGNDGALYVLTEVRGDGPSTIVRLVPAT